MNRMIKIYSLLLAVFLLSSLLSCKKYLDIKPNKSMVLPETMADCQALLDNFIAMNFFYPTGEVYADNYYLGLTAWNSQNPFNRDGYIWKADGDVDPNDWLAIYQKVLVANQVLRTLGALTPSAGEQASWNQLKASALFYRAFSYYQAAQLWTRPYDAATAGADPGLPLRLTPDIAEQARRETVKDTYERILQDVKEAVNLFPATKPTSNIAKTRPCLAAGHALLARVYLTMGNYDQALTHADLCLQNYAELIDYNALNPVSPAPLLRFNSEVIFHARSFSLALIPTAAKIDPVLYATYGNTDDDLRRNLYFKENLGADVGTYQFKGCYDGSPYSMFCGLATDEVYLMRAECYARAGNTASAMTDLNALLRKRFKAPYTDRTAASADNALVQILAERRKELLFRGLRWMDLRRLNNDPRFAVTLQRNLNGTIYTLPPNDLRYTLLIPLDVLKREPMAQNPR